MRRGKSRKETFRAFETVRPVGQFQSVKVTLRL